MLSRAWQFAALDSSQRLIFIQAWFLLGWMRAAILTIPLKHLTKSLQHHREVVPSLSLEEEQLKQAVWIGRLVASAAKYTPWESACLAQVLTAQRLLARRGIPGQFYLGVRKSGGERDSDRGLQAHAWLQCDELIVNGEAGHQAFAVVSTYSWGGP